MSSVTSGPATSMSKWERLGFAEFLSLVVAVALSYALDESWPFDLFAASMAIAMVAVWHRTPILVLLIPASYLFLAGELHEISAYYKEWAAAFALGEVLKDIAVLGDGPASAPE